MNWEDLRFFLAIAKAGTISSAAKDLNVDQATVSRRLASLEADLGVQLFIRLPRESRLTPTGEKILNEAKEIEAKVFTVARLSSSVKTSAHSRVAISAPPILARHFLLPLFISWHSEILRYSSLSRANHNLFRSQKWKLIYPCASLRQLKRPIL
ncbi:LysR family transcriptional regulator [Erwinia aphidicola]|uniref:LysR family transcriptional regulator n=1 Tax=Erwinia aphidicola TaxID=68334 RepID=UPI0030CA616F